MNTFATLADATAAVGSPDIVALAGYYALGDAPLVYYRRVAAQPNHPFCFMSGDGVWFVGMPVDVIDVRWLGARCNGVTDDRQAVLNATAAAVAMGILRVTFPAANIVLSGGDYTLRGVTWEGVDPNRTVLLFTSDKATAPRKIVFDGAGGWTGGGLRRLCLWAATGINGGMGVAVQGGPQYQPDETIFEDIKITGNGVWDYTMFLSGAARTPATSGTLVGLRKVTIRNAFFGRAVVWGFYAESVEDLSLFGCGIFGGASANGNGMLINGSPTVLSRTINIIGCNIQGVAWFYYTIGAVVCSYVAGIVESTGSQNCWVGGDNEGQYTNVGINNVNTAA